MDRDSLLSTTSHREREVHVTLPDDPGGVRDNITITAGSFADEPAENTSLQKRRAKALLQLPCVVRVLNLVLFGDGRCLVVPLLTGGGACAFDLWVVLHQGPGAVMPMRGNFAVAAETAFNANFGYCFCRAGTIAQLFRTVAEPHGMTEDDAMRALGRCVWAAVAATTAWLGWFARTEAAAGEKSSTTAVDVIVFTFSVLPMFYLCALWLWTNWLFWCAGHGVITRSITAASVAQRRASAAVFGLLDEMRSASQAWIVNHAVRTVTTVVLAEARLQLANKKPQYRAVDGTAGALLLLLVLVTAAAPGYVTTGFYRELQRKLAAVAHADGSDDGELGAPSPKDDTPTALMQRIAAAGSGTGMHFAGIPMTVEKAITVATVVFYVTRYFATN
jgi:hypothetical protein